jgi:hypothetical protein
MAACTAASQLYLQSYFVHTSGVACLHLSRPVSQTLGEIRFLISKPRFEAIREYSAVLELPQTSTGGSHNFEKIETVTFLKAIQHIFVSHLPCCATPLAAYKAPENSSPTLNPSSKQKIFGYQQQTNLTSLLSLLNYHGIFGTKVSRLEKLE